MRVLAVMAHPDDLELTAFGTLRRWQERRGLELTVVVASAGRIATAEGEADRLVEAKASAALLDADVHCLHLDDGNVDPRRLRHHLGHILRAHAAFLIVITHPTVTDGTAHQDHDAVGAATVWAARRAHVSQILQVEPIPYSAGFRPNMFVGIDGQMTFKLQAIGLHESQGRKPALQAAAVQARATWWAYTSGLLEQDCRFAEAFVQTTTET